MDCTDQETMQDERMHHIESKYRNASVEDNLARFEGLLKAENAEAKTWCLRAKIDMASPNGTMRDPVLYRSNDTPHHRTGTRFKAYPTYDFVCPIVDSIEGVTHAMRTTEYNDRDEQYHYLQRVMRLRHVHIQAFGKVSFVHTVLSKRKLTWFVENNMVDGWDDPRFPTIQGCMRRGMLVDALKHFILSQGTSKKVINMEWDKFWSENKRFLEEKALRLMGVGKLTSVEMLVSNVGGEEEVVSTPNHPKRVDMGLRVSKRLLMIVDDDIETECYVCLFLVVTNIVLVNVCFSICVSFSLFVAAIGCSWKEMT